jgi:UDP-N-acetyl-D-mannosaminuronate dehydrogenase
MHLNNVIIHHAVEAPTVIKNTQRDLNIALVNELAMIFNKTGIETNAVRKKVEENYSLQIWEPRLAQILRWITDEGRKA